MLLAGVEARGRLNSALGAGVLALVVGAMLPWQPAAAIAVAFVAGGTMMWLAAPAALSKAVLFLYAFPLFAFGIAYAELGVNPVYLADVLATLSVLVALPFVWPELKSPGIKSFAWLAFFVALLAGQAVFAGLQRGYVDAIKGGVLALYPLLAMGWAGWFSRFREAWSIFPRYILTGIAPGLALVSLLGLPLIPAAYGLYLSVLAAFAAVPGMPRRKLLLLSAAVGEIILIAGPEKRGPALAVAVSFLASWIAARAFRARSAGRLVPLAAMSAIALAGLGLNLSRVDVQTVPVAGGFLTRTLDTVNDPGSAAAENVTIRFVIWDYAIRAAGQHPLTGLGAGHPVEVVYKGNDVGAKGSGPHNSFIGYAFYAGFPSAILVVLIFFSALLRTWKARRASPYASALFGAVVGATLIALANVALESTYIAGPTWMILAWAHVFDRRTLVRRDEPSLVQSEAFTPSPLVTRT